MPDDDAGFFRSLTGFATEWVNARRRNLRTEPKTNVDSTSGGARHSFSDQDISWEDLRDIKAMREDGGQVAQLMTSKALLNFGEGAEFHVEGDDDTETVVEGDPMTLSEWLDDQFPHLDLLVLELGEDALWFPFAAGETLETRGGDYDELLPVDPWTLMPVTDARGRIVGWRQRVTTDGGYKEQTLQRDDLWHIVLNKSSARDETGISEVLRSKDEIQAFKENEQAINQAIELHGFPQRHIKAGREDGPPLRDDDLRRLRTIFDPKTSDANTAYFTGPDVDVDTLEAHQFDYTAIHEMDMRNLTTALGLPLEAGNVGSDGLGSGKPAELRFALLKLAIKANQRRFSHQFVDRVIRPIVREYSPFDADAEIRVEIDDPLEDIGEVADLLQKVGDYMTNAEARQKLDLPDPEDDEIAESFRSPADIEASEAGDGEAGGLDGLFGEAAEEAVDSKLSKRDLADPMANGHDMDPETGEVICTNADEEFVLEDATWGDLADDCPKCGEPLSHVDEEQLSDAADGGTDFRHRCLGEGVTEQDLSTAPAWDRPLLEMHRAVSDPSTATDRALVSFAESATPEFVLERIREAIMGGAMFSEYEDVPSSRLMDLRENMADSLTVDTGFTLDSITENLMDFEADLSRDDAERIARTESSAVLNKAREIGYEEEGDAGRRFYWSGAEPGDSRQTEACEWLIEQTNPFHGGDPVPMDELRDMVAEAPTHDPDMDDNLARPESWIVHPNERSTLVLAPEAGV